MREGEETGGGKAGLREDGIVGTREGEREGETEVSSDTDSAILKKLRMIIRYDQIILSWRVGV